MKQLIQRLVVLVFALVLIPQCGPLKDGGTACTPNVVGAGLTFHLGELGGNTYKITLCQQSNPGDAVYTVYGASDKTSLETGQINTTTAWRQAQITGTNSSGSFFQVTFRGSDNYFAIYQDVSDGLGGFTFSTQTSMVVPRLIPGH